MSDIRFGCFVILVTTSLCLSRFSLAAGEAPFLTPVSVQQGNSPDFAVHQIVPVDFTESGMTGFLKILQDKTVTPEYRQVWGASADPRAALGPDDPLVKSYEAHPLKNGRIRLIDRKGRVISVELFGEPLAEIETAYLYGTRFPTYLVSVGYGIGMRSYAGPATTLVEIRGRRLIHIPITFG